jgi:hypothetical protein
VNVEGSNPFARSIFGVSGSEYRFANVLRSVPVLGLALFAVVANNGFAEATSHLLACLSVVESQIGEAERECVWEPAIQPGRGRRLALTLEADSAAAAVVIPWEADRGSLVNGWLPLWTTLKAGEAVRFPPTLWLWSTNAKPFLIQAVAFEQSDPAVKEVRSLVAAMHQAGIGPKVLEAQAKKLRALVDRFTALRRRPAGFATMPAAIAGVFRGQFEWRNHAIASTFGIGQPALVDFSARTKPTE